MITTMDSGGFKVTLKLATRVDEQTSDGMIKRRE